MNVCVGFITLLSITEILHTFMLSRLCSFGTVSANLLYQCPPAEEGKDYSLLFKWRSPDIDLNSVITVDNSHTPVAQCTLNQVCKNHLHTIYTTQLAVNETSSELTVTVRMYNISRTQHIGINSTWQITHKNVQETCKVDVFSKIKSIVCNDQIVDNNVKVSCFSSNVFPKATCHINMQSMALNTTFFSTIVPGDPTYFNTNCFLTIPIVNLSPGVNEISVIMYPNVTDMTMDIEISTKVSYQIKLDYPKAALVDCPQIVTENIEVTCSCSKSSNNLIKVCSGWVDDYSGDCNNVLRYTPSRNKETQQDFKCRVLNYYGWENSSILYSPTIMSKFQSMTCNQTQQETTIALICSIENIYPAANCLFEIINRDVHRLHSLDNIQYRTEQLSVDPTYFKTICTLYIFLGNLSEGQYNILISMYPNITGSEKDIRFGINQTMFLNIVAVDFKTSSAGFTTTAFVTSATTAAGGILVLSVICIIFLHRALKSPSNILETCASCMVKEHSDYDDINDGYILAVHGLYPEHEQFGNYGYRMAGPCLSNRVLQGKPEQKTDGYETIDDDFVEQIHKMMNSNAENVERL